MDDDVVLIERAPTPAEYARLRSEVGWGAVDPDAAERGLGAALHSVCLEGRDGEIRGCGRVVGDGGIYFYLQDVVVRPPWQGRGYGRAITEALMAWIGGRAGTGSFVGLMAAEGVETFYHRFGFSRRPEGRPGMYRMWEGE